MLKYIVPVVRWVLFLLIGLPFQLVVYLIYPLVHVFWRLFVYEKVTTLKSVQHENPTEEPRHSAIRDGYFHDNEDDHSALSHFGLFTVKPDLGVEGLRLLIDDDGAFLRRYKDGKKEGWHVSGDCVANWCFTASCLNSKRAALAPVIEKAATHYLLNLGSKSNMPEAKGWVSSRCNNLGINFCPDGFLGLGQPCVGPQFYTTSALLALAYQHGSKKWKYIFWIHWILFGGWYWAFSPMLYTKKQRLAYVRDTTMRALWVHLKVFGPLWWVIRPMHFITYEIAEYENHLFFAMLGKEPQVGVPRIASPFFSQEYDGRSRNCEKANIWVNPAIDFIRFSSPLRERLVQRVEKKVTHHKSVKPDSNA